MKGHHMTTKTILSYERMRSSVNGNPRFRFAFTDGTMLRSKPDAGWAYAVGNRDMREGSTVSVELDGRGNIRIMRAAS
jgi:hypothetical protein